MTRSLRSLTPWITGLALGFLAIPAAANTYTFNGKFTSNRGVFANVPAGGDVSCGGLTIMVGSGPPGTVTVLPPTMTFGVNQVNGADAGCMGQNASVTLTTSGAGVGGSFTLPPQAFKQGLPPYLQVWGNTTVSALVQLATSNAFSAPPVSVFETPGGTQATGCTGTGVTLMCANHAPKFKFQAGNHTQQTGRAGSDFTWCPPSPPPPQGGPCLAIGQGGTAAILKYNGTPNGFGGTMGYVITSGPAQGSLGQLATNPAVAIVPFTQAPNSQASARGYADYGTDYLFPAQVFATYQVGPVYQGPKLGTQFVITNLGPQIASLPAGTNFVWGFPLTTGTVLVRNTGTLLGNPRDTTITAMGYDCLNAKGPNCSVTTGNNHRNISLVSGAVGIARLPPPIGDQALANMMSIWMGLVPVPEPGAALQLFSGALGLAGIAVWRSRRSR